MVRLPGADESPTLRCRECAGAAQVQKVTVSAGGEEWPVLVPHRPAWLVER